MSSCSVIGDNHEKKELVLVNSGESVLIFDLSITLSHGVSGLIKMLSLHQDIIPALTTASQQAFNEDRVLTVPDNENMVASQHSGFLQSLIST